MKPNVGKVVALSTKGALSNKYSLRLLDLPLLIYQHREETNAMTWQTCENH